MKNNNFLRAFMEHYGVEELPDAFAAAVADAPWAKQDIRRALNISWRADVKQDSLLVTLAPTAQAIKDSHMWEYMNDVLIGYSLPPVTVEEMRANKLPDGRKLSRALLRAYNAAPVNVDYLLASVYGVTENNVEELEDALKAYYNMLGARKPVHVYVSTDADDFFGLSMNCSWSSCVAPGRQYDASAIAWIRHAKTAVVYGTTDPVNRKKSFRMLLHVDPVSGGFVLGKLYGQLSSAAVPELFSAVEARIRKNLPYVQEMKPMEYGNEFRAAQSARAPYIDEPTGGYSPDGEPINIGTIPRPICIECGEEHSGARMSCQP